MNGWQLRFDKKAFRSLEKLSKPDRLRVRRFVDERLLSMDNPRALGKPLTGGLSGLWRYRIGNIRLVAQIRDDELIILVLKLGHRKEIYR
ncbi:MAG: type II toxin-antitoxin system RelE/ParE family toxin [Nitratireductor sp.]|nr:type II toxin-antitoxin system RelE/ParE family toxin [Nitratireductor sp.]